MEIREICTRRNATHYGFTVDDLKERKGLKEFFGFKEKEDQMTIDTTNGRKGCSKDYQGR